MVVIRFRNLNYQRPLGPPNGRKRRQNLLSVDGKLRRPGLSGGDPLRRVTVSAAELDQRTAAEDQRLVWMACDSALPVHHIGHAASSQIDAADNVVERVIFIDAHHIEDGLAVLLHRHSHRNAKLPLTDGGGVGGQIIRLLQKREKTAVQAVRRVSDPLYQPSIQTVQGDGVKLINLRRLLQHRPAALRSCRGI